MNIAGRRPAAPLVHKGVIYHDQIGVDKLKWATKRRGRQAKGASNRFCSPFCRLYTPVGRCVTPLSLYLVNRGNYLLCVCVCVYIYIYIYIYIYMSVCVCARARVCVSICLSWNIWLRVYLIMKWDDQNESLYCRMKHPTDADNAGIRCDDLKVYTMLPIPGINMYLIIYPFIHKVMT